MNNAIREKNWIEYRSITNEVPADYGPEFSNEEKFIRCCCTDQSKIGWKSFFHGRFTRSWGEMNSILRSQKQTLNEDTWSSKLIREYWSLCLGLWAERNSSLHGNRWSVSIDERIVIYQRIKTIYKNVQPIVSEDNKSLLKKNGNA